MNIARCQKIASRIHALLIAEIGQGIDSHRMLTEPLYARDVLLVCEALPGVEAAQLAAMYRLAAVEVPRSAPEPARTTSGITAFINSIFGPVSTLEPPDPPPPKPRGWFGRSADK